MWLPLHKGIGEGLTALSHLLPTSRLRTAAKKAQEKWRQLWRRQSLLGYRLAEAGKTGKVGEVALRDQKSCPSYGDQRYEWICVPLLAFSMRGSNGPERKNLRTNKPHTGERPESGHMRDLDFTWLSWEQQNLNSAGRKVPGARKPGRLGSLWTWTEPCGMKTEKVYSGFLPCLSSCCCFNISFTLFGDVSWAAGCGGESTSSVVPVEKE